MSYQTKHYIFTTVQYIDSAHCDVAVWVAGQFGGEYVPVCGMAESPRSSPEIVTTSFTDYTPVQNKKLKKYFRGSIYVAKL